MSIGKVFIPFINALRRENNVVLVDVQAEMLQMPESTFKLHTPVHL